MSKSSTARRASARKPAGDARFTLVYAQKAKPKARHLDARCWRSASYREATQEELKALPVCLHCLRRAERDDAPAQQPEQPKRRPVPRNEPAPQDAPASRELAAA